MADWVRAILSRACSACIGYNSEVVGCSVWGMGSGWLVSKEVPQSRSSKSLEHSGEACTALPCSLPCNLHFISISCHCSDLRCAQRGLALCCAALCCAVLCARPHVQCSPLCQHASTHNRAHLLPSHALQVATSAELVAAHVCGVPHCAAGGHPHHQEVNPILALLLLPAGLHHRPLHQLHGMCLVGPCSTPPSQLHNDQYQKQIQHQILASISASNCPQGTPVCFSSAYVTLLLFIPLTASS